MVSHQGGFASAIPLYELILRFVCPCSRYVLLSRPRTVADVPAPTPLEEELLASRFPDQSVRLLKSAGAAVRPTPPHTSYGITYSPFSMYG